MQLLTADDLQLITNPDVPVLSESKRMPNPGADRAE